MHHRAQIGRDNRQHRHNHPLGFVATFAEGLDHTHALGQLLALGTIVRATDFGLELYGQSIEVNGTFNQASDSASAHLCFEYAGALGCNLTQITIIGFAEDALEPNCVELVKALLLFFEEQILLAVELFVDAVMLVTGGLLALFTGGTTHQVVVIEALALGLALSIECRQLTLVEFIELVDGRFADFAALFNEDYTAEEDFFVGDFFIADFEVFT